MDADKAFAHVLAKVMILDVEVLGPRSHLWHSCQFQSAGVVLEQSAMHRCDGGDVLNSLNVTSRRAMESAMYSASVVLRDTSVCSLDCHTMGHPAYLITYPVLDFAVPGSSWTVSGSQLPQKSASTKHSKESWDGLMMIPLSRVPIK